MRKWAYPAFYVPQHDEKSQRAIEQARALRRPTADDCDELDDMLELADDDE